MGGSHFSMGKRDRNPASGEVLLHSASAIDPAQLPVQKHLVVAAGGIMRRCHVELYHCPGLDLLDGRRINREGIAFVDDLWVVPKLFGRSIVIEKTIELP